MGVEGGARRRTCIQLEEAERRDHRKLGAELDLFSFPDEIGPGLAVFHPKGGTIRRVMEDYSRQRHVEAGYEFVNTPHITKSELFETSGHLDWFADGMYPPMELDDGQQYYLKPMNCPFHILIFQSRASARYRELPLRLFEFGTVYRYEKSGVVHGLTRVRGMTQDDAHIFCTREQMADELVAACSTSCSTCCATSASNDFYLELSTKPEGKAVGTDEEWDEADRDPARGGRAATGLELVLDEGGGAFYGPKISVQARDAIGRTHQMSTIQLDFQLPAALRARVRRRRQRPPPPDHDPPCAVRLGRALHGDPDRALRRGAADVAEPRAGPGAAACATTTRTTPTRSHAMLRRDGVRVERRRAPRAARRAHPPGQAREDPLHPGGRRRRRRAAARVGVNRRGSNDPERGVTLGASATGWSTRSPTHGSPGGGVGPEPRAPLGRRGAASYVKDATADDAAGTAGLRLLRASPREARRGRAASSCRDEHGLVVLNAFPYGTGTSWCCPAATWRRSATSTDDEAGGALGHDARAVARRRGAPTSPTG